MGFNVVDSTTYTYDANNRIIRSDMWQGMPALGMPMELTEQIKYYYDANANLNKFEMFMITGLGGPIELLATYKNTFDSKTTALNPAAFPKPGEAMVVNFPDNQSVNNNVKTEMIDNSGVVGDLTFQFAYTYNTSNRPSTCVATELPANKVRNVTFFYQ
jgi:hypothetical protein